MRDRRNLCETGQNALNQFYTEKVCNQMEEADENFRSYFLDSADTKCPDILFCGQSFSDIENLNRTEISCDLEQIKIDRQLELDGICDRNQEFDWLMGNFTEEFSNDEFREIFFTGEEAKCPNLNICGRLVFFQPVISSSWYRTIEKVVIGGSVFTVGFCVLISISLVILAANFLTRGDIYKVIRFRPRKKPIRQISYKETKTDKPHHHKVAIQNPYE